MASKLSLLLSNALKSAALSPRGSIQMFPTRALCTGHATAGDKVPPTGEDQGLPAVQAQDANLDPFLQGASQGLVFGKLTGATKNALKTDIVHYFEGCNLTTDDIKVDYNKAYYPTGMLVQFSSHSAYETALKLNIKKGRFYRLEKVDRTQWDLTESYNGKSVLLQGIPRNAVPEDIERFLCDCNFDASNIKLFLRDPVRAALVKFPSQAEAMHAFRVKNHGFCLNSPIMLRVLH